jgi:flagellar biosynthesis protein FlhF
VPEALGRTLLAAAARIGSGEPAAALGAALDETFAFKAVAVGTQSQPVMLVGPPGAGKTVTCAKLLVRAHRSGRRAVAITCDTRRAGAVQQLQAFTRILGVPLTSADDDETLATAATAASAEGAFVVIDSPGANPFDEDELMSLHARIAAAGAEPILTLAAGGDVREAAEIAACFAALRARRLIFTRLDVSRRFGGLLAAAAGGRLALAEVGVGADVADGLAAVNPMSLARLLLPEPGRTRNPSAPREASR